MMRFDRFTERAQEAAARAFEIMQRMNHTQLDVEHMVLALLEQPEGVMPDILQKLNVDPDMVQRELERALESGPRSYGPALAGGQVYITPRVQRMLTQANEEAQKLNDEYISTEHLLLAVVAERDGAAARVLNEHGVSTTITRVLPDIRGGQRVTSPQAEPLSHAGKIQPRPD